MIQFFYKLTEDEIIWKRGVWFKSTGIVPYNRITNIDVV
ncbi:MAG: PH domain-containing protein [Nitrososphaerota archaeon]